MCPNNVGSLSSGREVKCPKLVPGPEETGASCYDYPPSVREGPGHKFFGIGVGIRATQPTAMAVRVRGTRECCMLRTIHRAEANKV